MSKLFPLIVFFLLSETSFSQKENRAVCDSIWDFHTVSFDVAAGGWFPFSRLGTHFKPSGQFDFGIGLGITNRFRLHLKANPRFLIVKTPIPIHVKGIVKNDSSIEGFAAGGWKHWQG
jgi:hypothetical protein